MNGRCDDCQRLLACEVEHICRCSTEHGKEEKRIIVCGDCAVDNHRGEGHHCVPLRD